MKQCFFYSFITYLKKILLYIFSFYMTYKSQLNNDQIVQK